MSGQDSMSRMSGKGQTTKLRAGVLGATGMVGQRLVTLLAEHPWFERADGSSRREVPAAASREG